MNRKIIILFVLILPLLVRVANYNLDRIHGDDIMSAYFSDHISLAKLNPYAGIPEPFTDGEAQFAPPFFILQKLFFTVTGANLLTIKLSILPYVALTSLMIFLIAREILSPASALIAVFLYAFLAFNIY